MASYSTYEEFIQAYGEDSVAAWASDGVTTLSDAQVEAIVDVFLAKSYSKINSYLSTRYVLPVVSPGDDLKEAEQALTAYKMTKKPTAVQTTKIKDDYTETVEWLKGISKGEIELEYTTTRHEPREVSGFDAEDRQFTHSAMRGVGGL